ncbi:GDP-mannose-dependent alpha-(1-6)-phosphatidylinositol monomannoside mannosyltransferase [Anatilimnocola aggregata]|uniref:GDP-mannose-dependent alpha-(1-6)-phosphatidylinositol monomannoside mannosyltransferase n=1 Tax=Anatilimnocola aggregata TaxID=2528021 RepID=A0A517YCK8_9BACT|nr:glycosyltransferase [Anatilimnocola aggregata]QDU27961.1 GDP-mannose-dependent alpha-(1-6)-phosphatidylinositol monomannoside mannosyltransferase [Anatilimnocola aggregata]
MPEPRIALVHDWLVSPGGAEKVLLELHEMYPNAPIYTANYVPEKFPEFKNADIRPTWLDRISLAKRKHQLFSVFRAWAFRGLDLSDYDIVISSCSAESKYVKTGEQTLHICYCHTPVRYYWSDYEWYLAHPPFGKLNWLVKGLLPLMIGWLRRMDYQGAQTVDSFVANSRFVQARIAKYYHKSSTVIHAPVNVDQFEVSRERDDYYLIVGRQVAYKRLDLAVDAFNELGLPLKVAGTGEEITKHKPRAKSNIEFLGRVPDADLPRLYGRAKGFIFPAEEDFGIVPIEAMANGTPVVAFGVGGALETVVEGKTGTFFPEKTPASLVDAVRRFETMKFDPDVIRAQAERFSQAVFRQTMKQFVADEWCRFKGDEAAPVAEARTAEQTAVAAAS